jgi:hypothetical protein
MESPKHAARSPDSDVSPGTENPRAANTHSKAEYFPNDSSNAAEGSNTSVKTSSWDGSSERKSSISFVADLPKPNSGTTTDEDEAEGRRRSSLGRKSSTSSVTFRAPRNPSLPQGSQKQTDATRIRASSPPHDR